MYVSKLFFVQRENIVILSGVNGFNGDQYKETFIFIKDAIETVVLVIIVCIFLFPSYCLVVMT